MSIDSTSEYADLQRNALTVSHVQGPSPVAVGVHVKGLGHPVINLMFDDGIVAKCAGCGASWSVDDRAARAQWWVCPSGCGPNPDDEAPVDPKLIARRDQA